MKLLLVYTLLLCLILTSLELEQIHVKLKHLDSTVSRLSRSKRVERALKRSKLRAAGFQHPSQNTNTSVNLNLTTPVIPTEGEYVMELEVGTPPQTLPVMLDTGSDLTWIKCNPVKHSLPFLPNSSTSYKPMPCNSSLCSDMSSSSQAPRCTESCRYKYEYGDGSRTYGEIAYESVTLGGGGGNDTQRIEFQDVMIGCARKLKGEWNFTQGLVGLGRKSHSLIQQLGHRLGYRFSYCLVEGDGSSLVLGSPPVAKGGGVRASIQHGEDLDETLYYVPLVDIGVGGRRLGGVVREVAERRTVIDSGTTYSLFSPQVFELVRGAVEEAVGVAGVERLGLVCFNETERVKLPEMRLYFGEAEVVLPFENTYQVVEEEGVVCLGMDSSGGELSIIGNMQQQNFHVVYDLSSWEITFQTAECGKLE